MRIAIFVIVRRIVCAWDWFPGAALAEASLRAGYHSRPLSRPDGTE